MKAPDPRNRVLPFVKIIALFLVTGGMIQSCVTAKRLAYLQEYEALPDTVAMERVVPDQYRVRINDNLFVRVVTPDPKWSMMFNTLPTQTGITATEQTVDLISYRVLQDGQIILPFIGSIPVEGLTIPEITLKLEEEYAGYISDADITVKLVNNYISLLGAVKMPGRYPIYKEHLNIFEALAMAGDLDDFSERRNMQLIRDTGEGNVIHEFDVTDRNLIHTDYYYVMPNDVIYAPPMRGRFFRMEAFPFALIFSSITTFILIYNFVNTNTGS